MIQGLKRLNHVALAVQDRGVYERTVGFYRKTLGMDIVRRWGNGPKHITMLDMEGCILEIVFGASGSGEGAIPHMALEVECREDVDRLLDLCAAAGCTVTRPPSDIEACEDPAEGTEGSVPGAAFALRNGFCLGPAGETIEFFWQKPQAGI